MVVLQYKVYSSCYSIYVTIIDYCENPTSKLLELFLIS